MSIVITSDKHYKQLAPTIRNILGVETQYKPSEMPQAILDMQNVINQYDNIANGAVFSENNAQIIGNLRCGMFTNDIKTFEIPESLLEIPNYLFAYSNIETVILHDNITSIGEYCFYFCSKLNSFNIPSNLVTLKNSAFCGLQIKDKIAIPKTCTNIEKFALSFSYWICIDWCCSTSIQTYCFSNCEYLETFILRNESSICSLFNTNAFNNTPITSGTGYIYVPSTLIESYKTATNWSTYANQFRALEDYTVDGTVTGELDESKI